GQTTTPDGQRPVGCARRPLRVPTHRAVRRWWGLRRLAWLASAGCRAARRPTGERLRRTPAPQQPGPHRPAPPTPLPPAPAPRGPAPRGPAPTAPALKAPAPTAP